MQYRIDIKRIIDNNIHIQGWCISDDIFEKINYEVYDKKGEKIDIKLVYMKRQDVEELYANNTNENFNFGFDITFPFFEGEVYTLKIITKNKIVKEKLSRDLINKFNSFSYRKKQNIINYFTKNTFKRAFDFLLKEGITEFIKKTKRKIKGLQVDYDYNEWYRLTKISNEELKKQKEEYADNFKIKPKFSLIIPIYDTSTQFLELLFDSIFEQTYQNFEICVADATEYEKGTNKNNPKKYIENLPKEKKERIKVVYLNTNKNIAYNTNEALKLAAGDYIVLVDHDDELTLDALYENVKAINENENIELIYSDEDKVDMKDSSYFEPHFKSDFNLDLLLSVNYFCHLTTIKKTLVDELIKKYGVFEREEYNGAQDYDLFLRLTNILLNKGEENKIYHIRKVLYHWRCHPKSTAKETNSKTYAFLNGKKAIEDFYKHSNINFREVEKIEDGFSLGLYHTVFKKFDDEPLISVIIPNKDHIDDLKVAMDSVISGNYKNIEFIVVENNSTDKNTFVYYDELKNRKDINVKVLYYDGNFNFSKINNYGVSEASGEYILFLNNDVEMINKNSIFELVSYIVRDDVGAVGAKLLYKDNTIQHAGVVIGFGGIAGHTFIGIHDKDSSYMHRAQVVSDYNAVTAACLMTKKTLFDKINGFDEKLCVAFNDIDLCMKIRKENKRIVYNPYASFYHYESKSRGLEDTKEKVDRFNREVAYFAVKWKKEMDKGDEYYNPNLTLRKSDFSLKNLKFEEVGKGYELPKEIKLLMKEYE